MFIRVVIIFIYFIGYANNVKNVVLNKTYMSSVLDISVSCFANYWTPSNPEPVNLISWLRSDNYANVIASIRKEKDKDKISKLKSALPIITPSGLFTYRKEAALIKHTGLIQFDIDFAENGHLTNYDRLKQELSKVVNIAYAGLSASGRGYWGLIPISDKSNHIGHFRAIQRDFHRMGIVIDPMPKNVCSGRIYSFDPEAYFAVNPVLYRNVIEIQADKKSLYHENYKSANDRVNSCIKQIRQNSIDITGTYEQWFQLGCGIASEFGESGRSIFHEISCNYSKYSYKETERQYDHCLSNSYKYTIGTFFHYCQVNDII